VSNKPKILVVAEQDDSQPGIPAELSAAFEVVLARSPLRALSKLNDGEFAGLYVTGGFLEEASRVGRLLQNERILEGLPEGVVLLDANNKIVWGNCRVREWASHDDIVGENFYTALKSPDILGPDFCPLQTALSTGRPSTSTLRAGDNRYFRLHAAPVPEPGMTPQHLIVTVWDITPEVLQQQKMGAIHQAGIELADLSADEIASMTVEERIELLKSNILHFTKGLLQYDVVEIRMLEPDTGRLVPLLAEGMTSEAANRDLYAQQTGNGVTGFVALTGKSYMCEDTTQDPLYLEGASGAKSSLTVPLILHDKVIGTFNVESPNPGAFSDSDLQFLEIFTRDVASAINTLQLLVAEKANAAIENCEAIHSAVALPIDHILNDAVAVMERYIGLEPDVVERLQQILRNARDIRQVIHKVGQQMKPGQALPAAALPAEKRPALRNRRILVVDADETVRSASHNLLERFHCVVETARDGQEALSMARNSLAIDEGYDAIIADIRLPDMSGHGLMVKLGEFLDPVPLILMTGFGYDPGHSIVKARQAGLKFVLYKPFRLDQLLDAVEKTVTARRPVQQ